MFATNKNSTPSNVFIRYRSLGFKVLVGVVMLGLFGAASSEFVKAWILRDPGDQVHLWHIAELAALAILLMGGVLFSLLREPEEKPLLALFAIFGFFIIAAGVAPFTIPSQVLPPMLAHVSIPGAIPAIAVCLLAIALIVLYPDTRKLFSFKREGRFSIALLVLTVLIGAFSLPTALKEFHLQVIAIQYPDVHAQFFHWIGSALMIVLLLLAGLMTATKLPGWKLLGIITGDAYIYVGIIAMLVPDQTGSWNSTGGMFTIIAGIWYILITLLEAQSTKKAEVPATSSGEDDDSEVQTLAFEAAQLAEAH